MKTTYYLFLSGTLVLLLATATAAAEESLEAQLRATAPATVAAQARLRGDPKAGALVFYKSAAACVKCHGSGEDATPLGPDLATIGKDTTGEHVVESILLPSHKIRQGYETVSLVTLDGKIRSGLVAADEDGRLVLRDATDLEQEIVVEKSEIDETIISKKSMMPEGLVASLRDERQFYDLVRYVMEVARGGPQRAAQLKPDPKDLVVVDDTKDLDHAGILRSLGSDDLEAGRRIYLGHCQNCHGADGNTPKLPTARAFGTQQLKYGADPYKMFLTLSRGNGLMTPMTHLSPKERYQVVHYIREALMKGTNPEYTDLDDAYWAGLPQGTGKGEFAAASDRDFGPVLGSQLGAAVNNALTFRLSNHITASYDLHRMRLSEVWQDGFLDLSQTQHYRQRGERMPQIDGEPVPGLGDWQWAFAGSFEIPNEAKPPRGPVRGDWLQYYGHYLYADQAVLSYAIHDRKVLETIASDRSGDLVTLHHTLRIEPGQQSLQLCVGKLESRVGPSGVMSIGTTQVKGITGSAGGHIAVVSGSPSSRRSRPHSTNTSTRTDQPRRIVAAAVDGDTDELTWEIDDAGRMVLTIPGATRPRVLRVVRGAASGENGLRSFIKYSQSVASNEPLTDPIRMTQGGPARWPQQLTARGELGEPINGYALDTIPVPFENPWNAWLRTSALDFFDDGRAVVTTHGGDVYIVSGIDNELENVTWKRFAAGLFEPFGVRIARGTIYVTCRDGIKRLHDYDDNGEADFIEAFWIDDDVSCMFHAYNFDLQTDFEGNFYFAKAGQYTHHHRPGTIMRIPPEGGRAEVVAWGLRTPNGMGKLDDGRMTVSDNQGPWMPAGKVSLVKPGGFLGNMPINKEQDAWLRAKHGGELPTTFDEPIIWTPQELDNSCGGQVWAADERFGPLSGRLIHSSFGKGWLYYLSLQEVDGRTQASIVALPHQWDAGVMRLRVNPIDGQIYGTGLSGWQGPAGGKDGCLQRLRYAGRPVRMIDTVRVTTSGLELTFSFALDPESARDPRAWQCAMWDYLWSKNYGSDQYSVLKPGEKGRDSLAVEKVTLIGDRTLHLTIPKLQVCDQVSIEMNFKDAEGERFIEHVYLTVHAKPEPQGMTHQ